MKKLVSTPASSDWSHPAVLPLEGLAALAGGKKTDDIVPGSGFTLNALWEAGTGTPHPNLAKQPSLYDQMLAQATTPPQTNS